MRTNIEPQKKLVALALLGGLVGSFTPVATADPIQLRPATNICTGSTPIDLGDYAIPCVTDWNGDGQPDLLVGYRYADKVAVFLNCGTRAQPAFTNSANLQAGGADIYHAGQGCGAPAPWACDYDCDGKRDLLVGTGTEGQVYFYRNTNSDANPVLAPGVALTLTNGTVLNVSYRATPYVHDWDEDGLNDLLCGQGDGWVYFFKNVGTSQAPAYGAGVRIQAAGASVNLGMRSVVRVFDWDGNGLKDLVGSSATGVYWCKNSGSNSAPVLAAPVAIRAPVSASGLVPINTGARMRLDLVDWNNDGVMDLLVGNADGTIYHYEGYRFGFTRVAGQPVGGCSLQWASAPFLKYHVLAGDWPQAVTNIVASSLPSEGKTTCWTNTASASQQFMRVRVAE